MPALEIPGGWGGSTNDPLEGKFQGGGGVKANEPSMGGMDIFWKHTFCLTDILFQSENYSQMHLFHMQFTVTIN